MKNKEYGSHSVCWWQDIIQFCKENIVRFKAPNTIGFSELPKTATGKIQKFKFREKEWQGKERMVN